MLPGALTLYSCVSYVRVNDQGARGTDLSRCDHDVEVGGFGEDGIRGQPTRAIAGELELEGSVIRQYLGMNM